MRKLTAAFLPFLFLLPLCGLSAEGLAGKITEKGTSQPVSSARISIEGTNIAVESGEDGGFEISDPPAYPLALVISSDSHQSLAFPVQAPPSYPLAIELEPLSVDLGTVETFAERDSVKASKSLDAEKVRNTSTGGDPFAVVDRVADVVDSTNPALENDIQAARQELTDAFDVPVLKLANPFNYRGLPYYSNAFFMERTIPLFFNSYTYTGNMISSIFPAEILGGMEAFGNGRDPSLGPGNGLVSSFSVSEAEKEQVHWTLYLSALAFGCAMEMPLFSGKGGLTFSLRKSLYEITWIPLAIALNDVYKIFPIPGVGDDLLIDMAVVPGNADGFVHFFWEPDASNRLQLDLLGAFGYANLVYTFYSAYGGYENLEFRDSSNEAGAGVSWTYSPDKRWFLKTEAHEIISWLETVQAQSEIGGERSAVTYSYPLNDLGGGVSGKFEPIEDLALYGGLSGRWIKGWYTRERQADPTFFPYGVTDSLKRDFGLNTGEMSSFARADWVIGDFELEPSLRCDWFPSIESGSWIGDSRLSPMLQAYWYPVEKQSLRIGGGMRYDRFDYFTRNVFVAERDLRLHEGSVIVIDDSYVQDSPSRLFIGEAEYGLEKDENSFRFGAYFAYIDELSGFDYQTYYAESDSLYASLLGSPVYAATVLGAGLKPADALWSAGASADIGLSLGKTDLDIMYSLGVSRYHVDRDENGSYEWVVPKSDVTHTVKLFCHWEPVKIFSLDATLKTLLGIPATLHRVDSVETVPESGYTYMSFSELPYSQYQFHDYMPRFSLDFKAILKTPSEPSIEWYADIARLISFPRYKEPAVAQVGFEEKSALDRKYDWYPFDWQSILNMKLDLGCRLKY